MGRRFGVGDRVSVLPDPKANVGIYDDCCDPGTVGVVLHIDDSDTPGYTVQIDGMEENFFAFEREVGSPDDEEWRAKCNQAIVEAVQNG